MYVRKISITALITTVLVILLTTLASSSPDRAVLEQPSASPEQSRFGSLENLEMFEQFEFTGTQQPAASTEKIQVRKGENFEVNFIRFDRVQYAGECPGLEIRDAGKVKFISSTMPPAPGRRVLIRNVTRGINDDPFPFTDREYDEGQYSEAFIFGLNSRHRGRRFSVLEGENHFTYEIKENDKVIEAGSFIAQVSIQDVGTKVRNRICQSEWQCQLDWSNKQFWSKENPELDLPPGIEVSPDFDMPPDFEMPPEKCDWVSKCHCPA